MKFEALKPTIPPEETGISEAEKKNLIMQLNNEINSVEAMQEKLERDVTEAEKSGDWSIVLISKKVLQDHLSIAKSLQRKLEGGSASIVSAEYKYKDGKGEEVVEKIELDFEAQISSMMGLYEKHGIEIPADFREQMQIVWIENVDTMREAIIEKGFDKVLFIPDNLPSLKELDKKMTAGYEREKGNETYWGIEADSITENTRTGMRMVLVHKASDLTAQPELKKTLGKDYGGEKESGKDNKAEDFIKAGEALTATEYFILQRDIFEKTGVHIDGKSSDGNIYWTWLPGSRVGSRVVHACFNPGAARVDVHASAPGDADPAVGCRPSRCFFKKK